MMDLETMSRQDLVEAHTDKGEGGPLDNRPRSGKARKASDDRTPPMAKAHGG